MTTYNKNILFVFYPGSGETYLGYCIKKAFNQSLTDFKSLSVDSTPTVFYKTNAASLENVDLSNFTVIYLVRDGRDAVMSQAFSAINNSNYDPQRLSSLIEEATLAHGGSYFNGWTNHINYWFSKSNFVFRFEDFIANPDVVLNFVAQLIGSTTEGSKSIESYNEKTFGDYRRSDLPDSDRLKFAENWTTVFSKHNEKLFYKLHYSSLIKFEYESDTDFPADLRTRFFNLLDHKNIYKQTPLVDTDRPITILIDASKLQMPHNDGIKRYVLELLKAYQEIMPLCLGIEIDVFDGEELKSIREINLDPYWYILPSAEAGVTTIKKKFLDIGKYIIKNTISQSVYTKLGLKYKQVKTSVKDTLLVTVLRKDIKASHRFKYTKDNYNRYDLVHVPLLQDVDFISFFKRKALITIHDLTHISHPQYHQIDNIHMANRGLNAALESKASFLAISKYTQKTLLDQNITSTAVSFVHEAADVHKFYPLNNTAKFAEIREKYNIPQNARFFLSLSTLEPRKNLKNAILGFQNSLKDLPEDFYFVIAGKNGWKIKEVVPKQIDKKDRILFTGFIDEDDLGWLYRDAYSLVYASHFEGFGLPILEAMSCAKPVIYGYNSSMIEICQGSGIGVDSESVDEISNAITKMANDAEFYNAQSDLAFNISNQFDWFKTGILTINQYLISVNKKELCSSTNTY